MPSILVQLDRLDGVVALQQMACILGQETGDLPEVEALGEFHSLCPLDRGKASGNGGVRLKFKDGVVHSFLSIQSVASESPHSQAEQTART
mgnify:CR=1 FL=1